MMQKRCLIIAEAGVNHNGDMTTALQLVDRAAEAGADFVKFQTFRAGDLASAAAPKADYQVKGTGAGSGAGEGQLEMLSRLELSKQDHRDLIARCAERGVGFLSTPFDLKSLAFLTEDLGLKGLKLGSGELTNAPLLLAAARSGADIILSSGMGTLAEVEEALGVLAFGMSGKDIPGRAAFAEALRDPAAWAALERRVTILHCTTEYPAPPEQTNLRAMTTLGQAFSLPVGYSDHTEGAAISLAAVALGATVLEKHFTLDRAMPGPDHAASLEPDELKRLVAAVRMVEVSLGSARKQPGLAECRNIAVARKSIVAARDLPAGHILKPEDLAMKRPGGGLSPMAFWDVIGQRLPRAVAKDAFVNLKDQADE